MYKVDGVIYVTPKFCDLHGGFFPIVKDEMDELKVPILHIERDYMTVSSGQVRTRVQAFIERL